MRKIKINPKYEHLRNFIESIPDVFEEKGREIYKSRNTIKVMNTPEDLVKQITYMLSYFKFIKVN